MKMRFKALIVLVILSIGMTCGAVYNVDMKGSPPSILMGGEHGTSYFEYTFVGGHTFKYVGYDLYVTDGLGNFVNNNDNPFSTLEIDGNSTLRLENGVRYITDTTYVLNLKYEVKETITVDKKWNIVFDLYVNPPGEEHQHWMWCNEVSSYTVPEPSIMSMGLLGITFIFLRKGFCYRF